MDYESDLRLLKRSFNGGGEGQFYLSALEHLAGRQHLDWLDIGIGRDGSALEPFIAACRGRGQTLEITGVDPDAEPCQYKEDGVGWKLFRGTFQDWCSDGQYDVINIDQAIYYLGDPQATISRALNLLRSGGLFIATCWSRDDALHRLRMRMFPDTESTVVAEDLVALVRNLPGFTYVETASFENSVRLGAWREDCSFIRPAMRVIARRPLDEDTDPDPEVLLAILDDFSDSEPRINIALCAIRSEV
ncbi:methyltransferase domain-containing protein [uncultured Tateyamaria sp.]|uniref:class I SAM-dependent methyltransferase n=1 Tax=uncultured Tateyamaria sp. TaxID=455651 RepID=UPI002619E984|nr:methyltransferase domain-containing protein [uncultured Tateyamaria sp.]